MWVILIAETAVAAMQEIKSKVSTITFGEELEFAWREQIAKEQNPNIYFAHVDSS
jgi:IS30 family transposase